MNASRIEQVAHSEFEYAWYAYSGNMVVSVGNSCFSSKLTAGDIVVLSSFPGKRFEVLRVLDNDTRILVEV